MTSIILDGPHSIKLHFNNFALSDATCKILAREFMVYNESVGTGNYLLPSSRNRMIIAFHRLVSTHPWKGLIEDSYLTRQVHVATVYWICFQRSMQSAWLTWPSFPSLWEFVFRGGGKIRIDTWHPCLPLSKILPCGPHQTMTLPGAQVTGSQPQKCN